VADSYYARRSARDPAWHEQQLREAAEREQRRRELDPEGFRAQRRDVDRRYRERVVQHGLTFAELHRRVGGDRETLQTVLNSQRARGTIDYSSTMRRYSLNGIDPALREALLDLD
jgi:CRP-like cAMP-binding protein